MALQFFFIRVTDAAAAADELNRFLTNHRVLTVERQFVNDGSQSFWAICVDYLPHGTSSHQVTASNKPPRKDYREALTADQFALFVKLRELRAEIARSEAIPVYTIFTNEQLATMVTTPVTTKAELEGIDGIGTARIEKYGDRFLDMLNTTTKVNDSGNR